MKYSFITESDEAGMGRIVVEDFRHGKPHLRYFGVPIEVARALSLAQSQLAANGQKPEGKTVTYRGSGSDLAKDVLALLDQVELKRFMECMPAPSGAGPVAWRFRLRNGDWHVVTDFPEWLTDKSTVQPLGVIVFPASGSDLERAALSASAEAPGREPTEIRKAIDALIRAAWEWGRICETDGVSFNGEGDGYVQWMKSDTMAAKVKLLQILGIEPAPDAARSRQLPEKEG